MNEIRVQGRWLADADRGQLRRLRQEQSAGARRQSSVHLSEPWSWRKAADRLMDLIPRTGLLKRLARGPSTRPDLHSRKAHSGHAGWRVASLLQHDHLTGPTDCAPGWRRAGRTTSRTRQDRRHTLRPARKSIVLKPLSPQFQPPLTAL